MNDWHVIKKNGWLPAVASCYLPEFPMEARSLLADWLWLEENKRVLCLEEESPTMQQHQCIYGFMQKMLIKLKQGIEELPMHEETSFCYKNLLQKTLSQMEVSFANDHLQLFRSVQESLRNEKHRLIELKLQSVVNKSDSQTMHEIPKKRCEILNEAVTNNIGQAKQICASIEHATRWCTSRWQEFHNMQLQLQQQLQAGTNGLTNEMQITTIRNQVQTEIHLTLEKCWRKLPTLSGILDELEKQILPELEAFKDEQRFVALGKIPEHNLKLIQPWYEDTYKCLCDLEKCLPEYSNVCQHFNLQYNPAVQTVLGRVTDLRNKMIISCLVIETQPNQILRKGTKFGPVILRVLLSTSSIIIDEKAIVAVLINEGQAAELYSDPEQSPVKAGAGDLKFGKGYPRVNKNVVEFKDLKLSEVKRKVKRGEKTVVEEKFCIYFKILVNMQGHSFTAWTTSLPLTITSHPNQEGEAWGTILWDNAFSEKGRQPFKVVDEVPCSSLIEMIDLKFKSLTAERRGLTADNKRYLKAKLFRNDIPANEMVSWKLFNKDPFIEVPKELRVDDTSSEDLPKKKNNLTFWEWVFSAWKLLSWCPEDLKLADQSLRQLWSQNKIIGFISEADMIEKLSEPNKVRPGTFLLRFSEKRPESIGIYYYNHRTQCKDERLVKLKPYTKKDLEQTPLQDRIIKNPCIAYLYDGEDKHKAFTRTSSRDHKTIDGYVDVGQQEYFSSSILERYKPGFPVQSISTPSPSSHSYLSYHSQTLSPGRSDNDNISNPPWHSSSTSNENSVSASALDDFYDQHLPEFMDMNEMVQSWIQECE
ncbi:unnamed protein product [Orchesella dallaii]|uniref:Signal transducer and activator of transcription n=1 Tax=Orchesella dallaii TaxID=48710 RepID=A0ABP1QD15_9HEXA